MPPVPKPPAFDAAAHDKAHVDNIRKPDGSPYAALAQFTGWKRWVDKLRDAVETNRVTLVDHKADIDEHSGRLGSLEARMAAVEAQPPARFP